MPYIAQEDRDRLDPLLRLIAHRISTVGELNYAITRLAHLFLPGFDLHYEHLNAVVGVLDCAKAEFQRRIVANFEDVKIEANGDLPTVGEGR